MKQKFLAFIAVIFIFALPTVALAQENILPGFNPNKLIDDKVFSDTKTFGGPEGIQKFLETKNSILANKSTDFLAKLKEPVPTMLKQSLEDPQPSKDKLRTAAELIWDAAQSSGLNPQVILVTLNKEQSLITGRQNSTPEQLQRALDFSMGFGCPDSQPCGELYKGFYFQLFGNLDSSGNRYLGAAKSLMRSFSTPEGRGPAVDGVPAKVGQTITLDNTLGGYNGVQAKQTITLSNHATAALYRYTPHVFNGNYNFYKFFTSWFRYPNGTLLRGPNKVIYIIQNGVKQEVPEFVAKARGLALSAAISASSTELESYTTDKQLYGPADNTIISVDGKLYVFLSNVKHPASSFVITQRGLDPKNAITVSAKDAGVFVDGPQLTPTDGTVLKSQNDDAIYLVEGGKLKWFSAFTFAQRKAAAQVKIVPDSEISTYPKEGLVAPLNGTVLKTASSPAVYVVEAGVRRPLTAELFRNHGYAFKDVAVLSDAEVNALTVGAIATPKDMTYFKVTPASTLFLFKEGTMHRISSFVAGQRRITPDYTFDAATISGWTEGAPIPPRDNTAIKGDGSPAVFLVTEGQLRPLTYQAYLNRKLTPAKISVVPQAEVDGYAKGDVIEK